MGCGAFFSLGMTHASLSTNMSKSFASTQTPSSEHTEEELYPKTYLSSPSTTPKAAWAILVTLGSYQPIICPAANTVCKCTDCKEQIPTTGSQPTLQVFFPALSPSQCCFHKET